MIVVYAIWFISYSLVLRNIIVLNFAGKKP